MAEEPLFDPSLKKKKKGTKKTVAFYEDPLGADADPTTPAPPAENEVTTHELQSKVNGDTKDEDELDFSDLKKKSKKKKEIPLDLPNEEPSPADGADLDFSDLKKKKKKKEIPLDLLDEPGSGTPIHQATAATFATGEDLDFSDLKKKKKKSKKIDLEAFERELGEQNADEEGGIEGDELDDADLGDDVFAQPDANGSGLESGKEPWLGSDRDYTYVELLSRFYRELHAANPALMNATSKRYTLAPPQVMREGSKKTVFANISDICKRMHRQPEHVIQFMFAEMGTTGSVDAQSRLVIKGRFQQKQIENILRRYIVEYVTCKTCKSPDTLLTKETRIFFVSCESCGSRRSVNTIKSGFQATVGKRRRAVA